MSDMSIDPSDNEFDIWRDKVVLGLVAIAALGAIFRMGITFPSIGSPGPFAISRASGSIAELIVAISYLYIGFRPRHMAGLWEFLLVHRILLFGIGVLIWTNQSGGGGISALLVNLAIIMFLLAAYMTGKGFRAWTQAL